MAFILSSGKRAEVYRSDYIPHFMQMWLPTHVYNVVLVEPVSMLVKKSQDAYEHIVDIFQIRRTNHQLTGHQ